MSYAHWRSESNRFGCTTAGRRNRWQRRHRFKEAISRISNGDTATHPFEHWLNSLMRLASGSNSIGGCGEICEALTRMAEGI